MLARERTLASAVTADMDSTGCPATVNELLGGRNRSGRRFKYVCEFQFNERVHFGLIAYYVIHKANSERSRRREFLARQEILSRVRCADSCHDKRADQGRNDSEFYFRESELCILCRDADVRCCRKAGASSKRCSVYARNHGFRTAHDTEKHLNRSFRVPAIFFGREAGDSLCPIQVRSGAEGLPISLKDDSPDVRA